MRENVAKLKREVIATDEYLNQVKTYSEREVFVSEKSINRNEFYAAATAGFKPSLILKLTLAEDYEGEKLVEYENEIYSVIRTYKKGDGLELVLEERIGDERVYRNSDEQNP